MRKPIIPQVYDLLSRPVHKGGLSKDMYLRWVHTPFYYKEEPKTMRFFESDWREPFTKVVWWVIPTFWLPLITGFLLYFSWGMPLTRTALLFGLGMLYWTFVEYSLHRFVFHIDEKTPDWAPALSVHFALHGVHHKVPNDRYRLVFPPLPAVVLCIIVGYLSRLWTRPFLPDFSEFVVFYCGMVLGYVLYDMAHYAFHHGNFSPNSMLGRMRKYHLRHHYNNQYNVGFGITSPLWDYVFGTTLTIE